MFENFTCPVGTGGFYAVSILFKPTSGHVSENVMNIIPN